ncbi:sugar transferase [Verrucomicrobium sp. BvORR106]|uniref:sugar transferase n=1 Tax=Verrucomicrobium sp. BvORR106 TaxID=1403819 RepID=UPI00056FA10A|nr:sugar transferase [Verrucomicrobium sp. BvORR106]
MLGRRQEINLQLHEVLDCVLLAVCLWLGHWLRGTVALQIWPTLDKIPPFSEFFWLMAVIAPFTPLILESRGFYDYVLNKTLGASLRQLLGAGVRIGVMVGFCEIFLKWEVRSRAVVVLGALLGVAALLIREAMVRRALRKKLAAGHADKERVLLAGSPAQVEGILKSLTDDQRAELEVVGHYEVASEPISKLVELLHAKSVSRVIFSVDHVYFSQLEEAVQACETEGVEAWLSADFLQTTIARPTFDILGGKLMLVFHTTPKISWSLWMKDVIDRVCAFLLLVATSPLWLIAMVGIRLSSRGPIFFTQDRAGRHGQPFSMIKFRTMTSNAEAAQAELARQNEMSGPVFKLKDDPRVFPFGRWLRRMSIDELPQLINILRGEMSLVGPRPLPVYEIQKIEKHAQRRRLSVKPGLTCLWQVMGRNRITSFEDWVDLDLKYIDNWSLWLDLKIMFKTIPAVLRGSGAH